MQENKDPIIIGSDHAAYSLKEIIRAHLEEKGIRVTDAGPDSEASMDYPDFGIRVAKAVS